jgi:hypothetical protein
MSNVFSFGKPKVRNSNYTTYAEVVQIVSAVGPEDTFSKESLEYLSKFDSTAHVFMYEDQNIPVDPVIMGVFNSLQRTASELDAVDEKLTELVPPYIYGMLDISINLLQKGDPYNSRKSYLLIDSTLSEEVPELLLQRKKLMILKNMLVARLNLEILERSGFVKFVLTPTKIYKGTTAFSLQSSESI